MRRLALAALAGLILTAGGTAAGPLAQVGPPRPASEAFDELMQSWFAHEFADLALSWGPPDRVFRLDDRRVIVEYRAADGLDCWLRFRVFDEWITAWARQGIDCP